MEINELTPAERRVRDAFPSGAPVDFRTGSEEADDPEGGGDWGPERTVRAEVLRALLLGGERTPGEVPALRVMGARITGTLRGRYAVAECAVLLTGCHFEKAPDLYGAQLRQLNLSGSVLPGLDAGTIRVDGVVRLSGCRIPGPVRLGASRIARALVLDGARIGVHADGSTVANDEPVLRLNHAVVEDDLWWPRLVVHGEARIDGAAVTGQIRMDDAELWNPGGTALQAENVTVGSDLHAMRLRVRGRVNLRGCRIPGQLNFAYARFAHPGGVALRASSMTVGELWLREAAPIEGLVNLRRSQIDMLHADPSVWPPVVRLEGLTYTSLLPHLPAARRLPLLEREEEGYVPFSYEQLTAAYRRIGDDDAARTVLLAKERRRRGTLPAYARLWGHLQDAAVGYGFRPVRAAGWLFSLLLVGTVAYATRHPGPLKEDEAPPFSPLFYTLDLLLPIVDFGQEKAFNPQGWYQWLAYLLIVTGWLLATTIAAGITRSVSRN
ncbi:membrane-associated oxidoreductase [Streptomyces griseus]|uniref:Membrane-associated oxidoreductase n=2 Tax=Streptomycetaceae TaxID=2062 RepID=A0ABU2W0R3_9ACTN|nr:membrane-associated oxidoreductase [Streptomyces griseus]ARF76437.1 membrane-associated oxidoreductase [Kitasatospora albolonga]MDT0491204.1 membrane-associated oxidoreductase [Streptomyces griseus]